MTCSSGGCTNSFCDIQDQDNVHVVAGYREVNIVRTGDCGSGGRAGV